MRNRHTVRALLIPLLATSFLLAGQLPAAASYQSTSDAAFYPLAICRDGISFLFMGRLLPRRPRSPP